MKQFDSSKLIESFGYEPSIQEDITLKQVAGKALSPLSYVSQVWDGYSQIKALPVYLPKSTYTAEVSKIIAKLVADVGVFWVGSAIGGILTGYTGPGAIVGAIAGGLIADYALGDTSHEIVDKIVDFLYPSNDNQEDEPSDDTQAAPINKWPTTTQEIKAFQKANGLKVDGLIGKYTTMALATQGIQPPAGFQMVGDKAMKAAPANPTDPMAQLPEGTESKGIEMKKTTETESIASIRDKLSIIENEGLVNEANPIPITTAMWDIIKSGVYNSDDIIKSLSKQFGALPGNIKKQVDYAIKNVGGKLPTTTGSKALATSEPGALARQGAKSGEYIGKSQQTGGLATKAGNVIDGEFKTVEKAVSGLGPKEMQALSKAAANNPGLKYSEKYAIQKMGLLNWLKANPGKASLISGIAGTVLGYTLGGDGDNPPSVAVSHPKKSGKRTGDPEVMDRQRKLNDLGANIAVDGIWGDETEKAYQEYWVNNFAKHNALSTGASPEEADKRQANWNAASQMGKPNPPIPGDVNAQIQQSELDKKAADLKAAADIAAEKAKKDQEEFAKKQAQSVAESISIRYLLDYIENK